MLPETPNRAESRPELGIQRRPADLNVPFQGMEAVGEPDIDVDDHGTRSDGPGRALADPARMFAEGPVKILVEHDVVLPQRGLVADDVGHGAFGLDEAGTALD